MTTRIMKFFLLTYVQKQQAKGKYQFMNFDNLIVGGGKIWTLNVFIRNTRLEILESAQWTTRLLSCCWIIFVGYCLQF